MIYSLLSLNRSFLFVMKSQIIFRNFSNIRLRFLSLSVYSRCSAARERIEFKRSILLNLAQSNSCRFAVRAHFDFRKSLNFCKIASQSEHFTLHIKSLNFYNDVRFWITRRSIRRRTTNHNHKQKKRRSEERIYDAKDNNLKKT
jgi:hypothetical protein